MIKHQYYLQAIYKTRNLQSGKIKLNNKQTRGYIMPRGIYIRTEEANKNMSIAKTGTKCSEETRKKLRDINIGKKHPHSEESKKKMSVVKLGKKNSEEYNLKIGFVN